MYSLRIADPRVQGLGPSNFSEAKPTCLMFLSQERNFFSFLMSCHCLLLRCAPARHHGLVIKWKASARKRVDEGGIARYHSLVISRLLGRCLAAQRANTNKRVLNPILS